MPLATLERDAPSLFRQGPSALSRLLFFCALSVFLMVADARFGITEPLRSTVSVLLQPLLSRPRVLSHPENLATSEAKGVAE